jgi:hypothetical protein
LLAIIILSYSRYIRYYEFSFIIIDLHIDTYVVRAECAKQDAETEPCKNIFSAGSVWYNAGRTELQTEKEEEFKEQKNKDEKAQKRFR